MKKYIIKRILLSIPLILTMSFIVFVFIKMSPGDYFAQYEKDRKQDLRIIERQKRELGYYKPVVVQYLYWLRSIMFNVKISHDRRYIADFEEREIDESYRPESTARVEYKNRQDKGYFALVKFTGNGSEYYRMNQFNNPNPVEKGFWELWDPEAFSAVEFDLENLGDKPLPVTITFISRDGETGEEKEVSYKKTIGVRKTSALATIGKYLTLIGGMISLISLIVVLLHSGFTKKVLLKGAGVTAGFFVIFAILIAISDYDHKFAAGFSELKNKGLDLTNMAGVRISSNEKGMILLDNFRLVRKHGPKLIDAKKSAAVCDFSESNIITSYDPEATAEIEYESKNSRDKHARIRFGGTDDEYFQVNHLRNTNPGAGGSWRLWDNLVFEKIEYDIKNPGNEKLPVTITFLSTNKETGEEKQASYKKVLPARKARVFVSAVKFGILFICLLLSAYLLMRLLHRNIGRKALLSFAILICICLLLYALTNRHLHSQTRFSARFSHHVRKQGKAESVVEDEGLEEKGLDLSNISGIRISSSNKGTILLDNIRLIRKRAPRVIGLPNFGRSFSTRQPVFEMIWPRMWNTMKLSFFAIIFIWLIAIPIGIYCAVHQYSIGDSIFAFFSFIGMSIPNFFFALLLLYMLSLALDIPQGNPFYFLNGIFPMGGLRSTNYSELSTMGKFWDQVHHLILPVIMTTLGGLAGLQRQMRGNLLEELRQLYVTTARSKGLPESKVIYKHALRNAINPMVTYLGYFFRALVGSSALVEIVFAYPGVGGLMLEAVLAKDLYVVMGNMMLGGVLLIFGFIIADILLAMVDPRIRYD